VLDALHFHPEIEPTEIGVEVESGIVTLAGIVDSEHTKWMVEHLALGVADARAVANELVVRQPATPELTDAQIAARVVTALDWNPSVPQGRVKVGVTSDSVVLEGTVNRDYEKSAAERIVRRVVGARQVTNHLVVSPMAN
jgi:osmotically-inducible protein OsmY